MWVAVIFFCFLLFGPSQADNGGQCEIDGISDLNWSVSFTPSTYDNEDNKEIFAGSYTGTLTDLSCTCSSNCNSKHEYFTFSSNDTYFGISTSEYMTQVDQDYSTTNEIVVGYKCTMTCKDISTLSVIITIQDYNSYDPAFENPDGYTYKVASPIMPKTDFSVYGDSIIVTDLDFSNTDIVFTIEPNDFTISTTVEGNKAYLANFKANQPIILSETTTYYLTATDSGTYPHTRNTTIPITLEVDESTSLEVPTFVFPNSSVTSYTFQYEDDGTLTALSGTITLSTNKADTIKNTDYGINGEYSESFSIEFVVDTKTFVLTNTQLIENPSTFITILTLSVTTDTKVSVPIVIKFSSVQSPVYFNRPSYTATYIEGTAASVKLDQDIQVISDTTPQVSLSSVDDGDDLSDRFTIALDDKSNSYLVTVKTPLTTDEIKSNLYLNLLITAKVDTESSTANLIISIPSHTLQFTEVLYTVTYTDDDTIDMGETSIAFTNGATNIIITVDDAYEKYLEVNDKYELEVKEKLPSDILLSQADITVTVTAKDDYDNQAQAVIKVALPLQDTLDAPKFTKPYYKISYSKDNQADYIDFEDPITFDNVNDMSTINIDLSNYGDNFKVEYDTDLNKWRIHVDKPLNSSIFDNNVELITTMQAKKESVYDEGLAVLVIQLDGGSIDVNVPAFKDAYYTAVYPKEGQGTISFENNVDFDNVENINDVTITITDYTDNFEVTYNSSEKAWQINIIKPLDDSVLSKNTFLTSTLSAKINGDSKHNPIAAFVLTLPEQEVSGSITFSKAYYEAQYVVEGSTATVTLEDNIEFDGNVNVNNIEITADEYSVYFSFSYDDTSKIWKVKTENILDLNTLSRTNLVVSITATDKTTDSTGVSVIDLKLPNINTGEAPKFSKPYYTATYQISDGKSTVTLDDPLEITTTDGNMDNIGVATDKYNENFDVKYTDGKWSIEVTIDLDQEILKNRVDLAMSLIASDKTNTADVGLSALVISLPKVNNDDAPLFSSTYYESQLNSSTTVLETTTSIQISNKPEADLSKITVAILENDYKSNFDVNFDETSSSWLITVVSLPEEAMKTSNGLVLTLTAIETGNESNIGLSALVLSFPVQTTTPTFSSSQYFGNYTDETLQIDDVIITNIDDQSDITVKLDGDFSDNLEINYDEASKTWKIKLSKPFNDDDIRGKSELIMTLSATETGNDNIGYATVIIYLLSNSDNGDLSFSAVYYEGQYKITGGDDTLTLSNDIKLVSDKDLSSAVVVFEISDEFDPTKYFDIASTDTTGTYTITVKQNLPSDILTEQSLVTTLKATLENSQSYATLVIKLPAGDSSIEFSKVLYNGEYKWIDSTTDFTVEDITFTVPASDTSDIKVSISTDPQYSEYFSVTTKDNKVTLKAAEIPTDVLETVSVIPITLTATSSGTSKPGSTVVNININYDKGSLAFSAALYNGKYSIQKGEAIIEVDTITLNTDRTNDDLILVTVDNSYKDYFSATYKAQTVTLVKEQDIPSTIIADIQTISIQLSASISNTNVQSQSVVNLRIINGDDPIPDVTGTLQFDNIVNTGQYSVINGDGVYEADAKIGLTTDRTNEEVEVNIKEDSEFKDYFKISYENQIVNVSLVQNLPDDVFLSNKYISLTLVASTTDKTLSSSAVLNIRMNNDDVIDNGYISFVSTVYNGKYEIKDAEAKISYDEIKVVTDQEDQNIVMSLEGSYAQYFEVTYTDKTINLTLIDTDANENLRTLTNLAVVVKAQIKDTNHVASAVVNFQVIDYDNGGNNDGSISIPSLVYTSEYDLDIATFETCEIPVQTQHLEQELTVKMSNEYKYEEYFNVAYSQNNITISLNKTLPASKIEKLGVIAMSIKIYLTDNKDIFGEAVLNIRIHKKSKSTDLNYTGYIVAISIMGALLFLLIAGTVAFYFFKFKKGRYKQMTEEEYINSKVKFDKTSLKRQSEKSKRSSALDERRPTGFVFHPSSNELDKEPSDSSTDEMKERKKSVAFDENVEKMQIDTINDDDIDKALNQNEKGDAANRF